MTTASIRGDDAAAPGESLPLLADFAEVLDGDLVLSAAPTLAVERKRGSGSLTLSAATLDSTSKQASYTAAISDDATRGSVFVITATGEAAGSRIYKVAQRLVING